MIPESDKESQKRQAKEFKARVNDYVRTFCSEYGRRVLKDMRRSNRDAFDANPFTMAKNLGKQELIREIEDLLILAKNPQVLEDLFVNPEDDSFTIS